MGKNTEPLGLTDFIGTGRFLNTNNFKEVQDLRKAKSEKDSDTLEKGELGDALGYGFSNNNKFTKKGSEIVTKVNELKTKVEAKKATCLASMTKIVLELGDMVPTMPLDEWDKRDVDADIADTLKRYSWEQTCYNDGAKSSGMYETKASEDSTASKVVTASTQEEADKARLYNNHLYQFLDCCRDIGKADAFLRNVDEKKSYELSLTELKALGF